jgi:dienelactone hydrolase
MNAVVPLGLLALTLLYSVQVPAQEEPALQQARQLIKDLAAGRVQAAYERFDPSLQAALPPQRLAQAWEALEKSSGKFVRMAGVEQKSAPAAAIVQVVVQCEFEHGRLEALVTIHDGKIVGLLFRPLAASAAWTAPAYARPETFYEVAVNVVTDRWQLPGTLTLPAGSGPFPAVVLVHGSGPQDADETVGAAKPFKDLAWGLASLGIAVLRYVKRTRAYGAASAADPMRLTVQEETVDDAVSALRLLASRREVDPGRIFLLGHSLGATLAPRIARRTTEVHLAGLILLAGAVTPIERLALDQVRRLAAEGALPHDQASAEVAAAEQAVAQIESPELKPDAQIRFLGSMTPASYWLDLRGYDPAAELARLKLPVLLLQGTGDRQVPASELTLWTKRLDGRSDVQARLLPGLNHFFAAADPLTGSAPVHVDASVVEIIANWILKTTTGR